MYLSETAQAGQSRRQRHQAIFIALGIANIFLFSVQAVAEDQAIAKLFARQGIDGTVVIASLHSGQTFIHNALRANHGFTAVSTFKILNMLIALEEKVISGKDDVFKWNGHTYQGNRA